MTEQEFRDAMAPLGAVPWKYGKGLTRPIMRFYFAEFGYLEPAALGAAVRRWAQTEREFPTVADLRAALGMDQRPGLVEGAAVFEALLGPGPAYDARQGDYWTLQAVSDRFGPAALAAFMAAGGTRAFRDRTVRNVDFLRRDFLRGWEEASAAAARPPALAPSPQRQGLAPVGDSVRRLLPADFKDAAAGDERGDAWEPPITPETP